MLFVSAKLVASIQLRQLKSEQCEQQQQQHTVDKQGPAMPWAIATGSGCH